MKHISKFTIATATLLLLTTHAIHAETDLETITGDTTAEVQPSENTSNKAGLTNSVISQTKLEIPQESKKTAETTQQTRSHSKREVTNNINDYYKQQNYISFTTQSGEPYYYLGGTKLTSQWKYINSQYYSFNEAGQKQTNTLIDGYVIDGTVSWLEIDL